MKKELIIIGIIILIIIVTFIIILKINNPSYSPNQFNENCNKIGDGKKSIIFLPDSYTNYKDYENDVFKKINSLKKISPFENSFTFYYLKFLGENFNCKKQGYVLCDSSKVQAEAKACPHNYIIVLSKNNDEYIRSTAYMNIMSINTADDDEVIAHELGHAIASLADEYVEQGRTPNKKAPNCDKADCKKWVNKFEAVGCFKGCTSSDFFRATKTSIMRDCYSSKDFGVLNIEALKNEL